MRETPNSFRLINSRENSVFINGRYDLQLARVASLSSFPRDQLSAGRFGARPDKRPLRSWNATTNSRIRGLP